MAAELVVIGGSLGGTAALETVLGGLPKDFPVPVAVVLHRLRDESSSPVSVLERHCALPIEEAEDKTDIRPGHVYIAPADYHLLVERGSFALSVEPPVRAARPSIDVLYESAAEAYGKSVVGVVLTGTSEDGARGTAAIRQHGGVIVAQDPATAESPLMPRAAAAAASGVEVLPLTEIGPFLVRFCGGGKKGSDGPT